MVEIPDECRDQVKSAIEWFNSMEERIQSDGHYLVVGRTGTNIAHAKLGTRLMDIYELIEEGDVG